MSRKKRKSRFTSVTIERRDPDSGNLMQRADTAAILYGTMQKVAKEGPDGVKQALVTVNNSDIQVDAPSYGDLHRLCQTYGVLPSMVASETEPTPLITRYEEDDTPPQKDPVARTALRQILRRLVDEV